MTNLKVEEYKLPEVPRFNYEELKADIIARTEMYKHMVYTENDIRAAKADRSELNSIAKALNDERISLEREYNKPFTAFKEKVNEVIGIIKEASNCIDVQVKEFEAKEKAEKETACRELFDSINTHEWFKYEQVFRPAWLNKSAKLEAIKDEINIALASIDTGMSSLEGLEYEFEAIECFKRTLSLASALEENKRLGELAKKKAEAEARAEEQRKAEELAKAVKEDEAPIIEEVKKEEPAERYWTKFHVLVTPDEFDALCEEMTTRGYEWKVEW